MISKVKLTYKNIKMEKYEELENNLIDLTSFEDIECESIKAHYYNDKQKLIIKLKGIEYGVLSEFIDRVQYLLASNNYKKETK